MNTIHNDNLSDPGLLDQIREMAGHFLSVREIAYLVKVDFGLLYQQILIPNTPPHLAYHEGKTTAKYEIRKKVLQLAKMGSPQAETLAEKYIEEQELDDNE